MQEIMAYQTDDGKIFKTEAAAKNHEAFLEFRKWYEDNALLGNRAGSKVEYEGLLGWLSEHIEIAGPIVETMRLSSRR